MDGNQHREPGAERRQPVRQQQWRRQPASKVISQRPVHTQKSDARLRDNTVIGSGVARRRAYPTKEASGLDYAQLARLPGTKIVIMGVERIGSIAQSLIAHGMDASTPVGMVRWGTTGRQQSIEGTLGTIADVVAKAEFTAPAVTIIGGVVGLRGKLNWFERRRALGNLRFAAVGPATAAKLKELRLRVDAMPEQYLASMVAAAVRAVESVENIRILLARAQVADAELSKTLEDLGAIVDDVAFYKTVPETEDLTGAASRLVEKGADWITFTSSSTVENFHARFDLPTLLKRFPKTRLASIGPETSKALEALGLKPAVEARQHTIVGLVQAVLGAVKKAPPAE